MTSLRLTGLLRESPAPAGLFYVNEVTRFGMKTAVSIPDDLFARAEALAAREGKSRSQVYREALTEYVLRRDARAVTAALDELADELGSPSDAWSTEAGRRALARQPPSC